MNKRKIVIDASGEKNLVVKVVSKNLTIQNNFSHKKRDSGAGMIKMLKKLRISRYDELCVVTGPGNFTACRLSALFSNAVAFLSGCKLFSKNTSEKDFNSVKQVLPFYESAPKITQTKR